MAKKDAKKCSMKALIIAFITATLTMGAFAKAGYGSETRWINENSMDKNINPI
jgi:hypothetical protein